MLVVGRESAGVGRSFDMCYVTLDVNITGRCSYPTVVASMLLKGT